MAQEFALSFVTVARISPTVGQKPHRTKAFKLSRGPLLFTAKARDIVGLCLHLPERKVEPCVDETARIQTQNRTQACCPSVLESLRAYHSGISDSLPLDEVGLASLQSSLLWINR